MSIGCPCVNKPFRDALVPSEGVNIMLPPARLVSNFCEKFHKHIKIEEAGFRLRSLHGGSLKYMKAEGVPVSRLSERELQEI